MKTVGLAELWSRRHAAGGPPATWWFSQYLGAVLAWLALLLHAGPAQVTLAALLTMAAACAAYALGAFDWPTAFAILVLFQLSYGLDCADGQVARATARTSEHGAWLDVFCDFIEIQMITFAIVAVLLRSGLPATPALGAGLIWASGRTAHLYTATRLRLAAKARLETSGGATLLRLGLTTLTDTPVVLLVLVLLRQDATLLALVASAFGVLGLAHSTYVAGKAFARAADAGSARAQAAE